MNSPGRVIGFVNAAHFIDHYAMLIFAAAVIIMGPALGMAYSELLPYATPGFVAFGAGSLITGWLGDRWSRRHMMVIFFWGIGASMIAVGFVQTPLQLGAALLARVAKQDMWRVLLALLIVVIAISTTFNAITVAMPKLFAERLAGVTQSPALLGVIAAGVYVFGAMTQYTIGRLIDHYSLKTVMLPLSFMLAPFIYFAATLSNLPLIIASIGLVMGAFGQVTVNDAMVGKYTSEEWRSRAYSVRYFIGFTAAGASVGLVAWLYEKGGFVTMLQAFAALCLLVIAAAIILPT